MTVEEGRATEVNLAAGIIRLTGRLTSRGSALKLARITAAGRNGREGEAKSDLSGNYNFELPFPGTYVLDIWPRRGAHMRLEVSIPEGVEEVRKDIDLSGGEVSGTVIDAETGEPVRGADVSAIAAGRDVRSIRTRSLGLKGWDGTDSQGRFAISQLPPGSYSLQVEDRDHVPAWIEGIAVGEGKSPGDQRIVLEKGVAFRARVQDEQGRPVSGAGAILRDQGVGPPRVLQNAWSDIEGIIEIQMVRPGSFQMTVGHTRFAPSRLQVRVPPAAEPVFIMKRGGSLRLEAVDPQGRPVPGAEIVVLGTGGEDIAEEASIFANGIGPCGRMQVTATACWPFRPEQKVETCFKIMVLIAASWA